MPPNTKIAGSVPPLSASALRVETVPGSLGFKSTDDLESIQTLIGQERALGAIRFGSAIDRPGYNMFVLGPQGTGRHTAVLSYLGAKAANEAAPDDWVYVHNFEEAHKPKAIRLPAGMAIRFRDAMQDMVEDLRVAVPSAFQSDEYREKHRAVDAEFEDLQEKAFDGLREKAQAQDIAILRTPMGFALAPTSDGNVIKPEVFNALPKQQRADIEQKISELQSDLEHILERMPLLEKEHRDRIRKLNAELADSVVDASIRLLAVKFSGVKAIQDRLAEVRKDIVERAELFLMRTEAEVSSPFPETFTAQGSDPRYNRYLVNVMVSNDGDCDKVGAPLVTEDHPTLANVVGRIEHISQMGALVTDFTMIRPGALHRANGGYVVLDARKILTEPFCWEALKRALRGGTITIVSAAEELSLTSTISLQPEPIPLKVKVALVGERILYYLLSTLDPDFSDLFKVEVDFDEELPRTAENISLYARFIGSIAKKEELRALNARAVARVIDEMVRYAEDGERLSLKISKLADLLREADFWAAEAGRKTVSAPDVERAIKEQIHRADRIRDRSNESIIRETVLIDTDGEVIGQVNGLSVLGIGNFSFGKPTRITARARAGSGKLVDIERETKLGGPIHSKGVLILSGFLSANFALDAPMSLWASIVFEQSYGGVEGDSASSAELYALLSALAGIPIRQSFAVTGSVNQHGQAQAIGGVNEKIEGFFDICDTRGLTGQQGVLIPASNVKHLMVRADVREAVKKRRFNVYPIERVEQGIELLTGMPAGVRDASGQFPDGTVYGRVEARLREFAATRKAFAVSSDQPSVRNGDT
jgi:lon-related putative ATP-dependent protease